MKLYIFICKIISICVIFIYIIILYSLFFSLFRIKIRWVATKSKKLQTGTSNQRVATKTHSEGKKRDTFDYKNKIGEEKKKKILDTAILLFRFFLLHKPIDITYNICLKKLFVLPYKNQKKLFNKIKFCWSIETYHHCNILNSMENIFLISFSHSFY